VLAQVQWPEASLPLKVLIQRAKPCHLVSFERDYLTDDGTVKCITLHTVDRNARLDMSYNSYEV
jgi:hypothetical protein